LNKAKAWSAQGGLKTKSMVNRGMTHAEDFNPVQNNPFERVGWPLIWIWKSIGTSNIITKLPVNGSPKETITQQRKLQIRKNMKQEPIKKALEVKKPYWKSFLAADSGGNQPAQCPDLARGLHTPTPEGWAMKRLTVG
jgi:hypothetical protein